MGTKKQQHKEPSKILLDEYFAAQDDRFIDLLKEFQNAKFLLSFVVKWINDKRPWARDQKFKYLNGNLNLPGHEVVFKRLYKNALANSDHELMGVFLVTLDRMVRRVRATSYRYDFRSRRSWTEEILRTKRNKAVVNVYGRTGTYTIRGREYTYPIPDIINKADNVLFSNRTRNYLRRSAWRYFRRLSFSDPQEYVSQIGKALALYEDQHMRTAEAILDNRSLMHICYYHDSNITLSAVHSNVAEDRSLNNLNASPYQSDLWKSEPAAQVLIQLMLNAKSTLVRMWSIEMLMREHADAAANMDLEFLIQLMSSPDPNIQEFALTIFGKHPALPILKVDQWLNLLETSDPSLLENICNAMREHVANERIDNSQIIKLACAKQFPVAEFGFELVKGRDETTPMTVDDLIGLAECNNVTIAEQIVRWALERIPRRAAYDADNVIDFFDSMMRPTRQAAMKWIANPESEGFDDARLWARLVESPFDEIKTQLINILECRRKELDSGQMVPVWISVILGIHCGSRTKPKAINQVAQKIESDKSQAEVLLPVLAVALRSIRAPEMRSALSTVVQLHGRNPDLQPAIRKHFPEIEFQPPAIP